MNIVKITYGLGNQMFQYAFARSMQIKTGKKVYLDNRYINTEYPDSISKSNYVSKKYGERKYELYNFNISLPIAEDNILKHWDYLWNTKNIKHDLCNFSENGVGVWRYRDERKGEISKESLLPTYYTGFFLKLNYYDEIKRILQKEFTLKNKITLPNELKKILREDNTVSIHIRRGDYLRLNRDISQKDYYGKALSVINNIIYKPTYLVFSDDIEWVRHNLHFEGKVIYVSNLGFQDYEEMMIMKHCKHNIIANSTFSYWAAYLNSNPNKIVICPKRWESNIILTDWIKV
jgi:hypothetical protein